MVGVDVGFENPMFACLEMDYEVGIFLYEIISYSLMSFHSMKNTNTL